MAEILGEPVGKTVGYRVRLEKAVSEQTRIEVVTEGILTRLLQDDPTLEGISAILFDEFHERSLQADLDLALTLDTQNVLRPDLRIILMSATLDAGGIGRWLEAPVIRSLGQMYPVETHYLSPAEMAAAGNNQTQKLVYLTTRTIRKALTEHQEGDILVFLPGLGEMKRVADNLEPTLPPETELHLLHGELSLSQQQAAINPAPKSKRKVVLATSIAETSLTIRGVRIVIDGGLARVSKFMPRTGFTNLITVPVSQASADQRRGRAGRLGPGICYRLWTTADQLHLVPQLPPEILEADLSSLALELAVWGVKDIASLKWLDMPPAAALSQARDLLIRLEAITPVSKPTAHGKMLATLGMPPRLGHLVVRGKELRVGPTACTLAAMLAERDILKPVDATNRTIIPDLQLRLEVLAGSKFTIPGFTVEQAVLRRIKQQAQNLEQRLQLKKNEVIEPEIAGLLTAFAFPERLAQRETSGRVRLATGQRAALSTELFGEADFYGVAHLDNSQQPKILLAAPISKAEILKHFASQVEELPEVKWDENSGKIVARKVTRLGALILEETVLTKPDPELIANALFTVLKERGITRIPWNDTAQNIRQRLAFLHQLVPETWPDVSDQALEVNLDNWLKPHLTGLRSFAEVQKLDFAELLLSELSWEQRTEMEKLAPNQLEVPTGSRIAIDYSKPEAPVLAVRLQEIFGMLETPCIGGGKVPLLIHLLSPAYRPVQVTRDLHSFWTSGYFEVRKDLRGRYPKHYWPEDPLTAAPVRGVKRKMK
jgi:ATP-dependent helicase HrpB